MCSALWELIEVERLPNNAAGGQNLDFTVPACSPLGSPGCPMPGLRVALQMVL